VLAGTLIPPESMRHLLHELTVLSGYDFSGYASASCQRLLASAVRRESLSTVEELCARIQDDVDCRRRVLRGLVVPATQIFRDPEMFAALRGQVLPYLATWPKIRIWIAGCATGEEVWSLAVLLAEEGLLEWCTIWATDVDAELVEIAQRGIYHEDSFNEAAARLRASGGGDLSTYLIPGSGRFVEDLRDQIHFSQHNLALDGIFNEFHLILCRNVLLYFGQELRQRALSLLVASLADLGVLCLGAQESSPMEQPELVPLDALRRLYRKEPAR
jgi:chemotaxis protein methyltransferase CheR